MIDIDTQVKTIQDAVASVPDIVLDRIIGYGSYWWGGYLPGESDIDITVIVTRVDGAPVDPADIRAIEAGLLKCDLAAPFVSDLFAIERRRAATTGMHGKILARGVLLFANADAEPLRCRAMAEALPYPAAREELVAERRRYAARLLAIAIRARECIDPDPMYLPYACKHVIEEAQAAAVFGLWAALYASDIDPSPKALRWNAGRLAMIAAMFDPMLARIVPVAKRLPNVRIFMNESDGLGSGPDHAFTRRDATRALNAAKQICAALGIEPELSRASQKS